MRRKANAKIPYGDFETIWLRHGLRAEPTGNRKVIDWVNVHGPAGNRGARLYVQHRDRVGAVDISSFDPPVHLAIVQIPEREAQRIHRGRVRGRLDFSQPAGLVLDAFEILVKIVAKSR